MTLIGLLYGLAAATSQSFSYVFSRRFLTREGGNAFLLMVLSHLLMGVMGLLVLPFVWSDTVPPLRAYFWPLLGTAGFYALGQFFLFVALTHTDSSRISPLLGLKILALAAISVLIFRQPLGVGQWGGVLLCAAATLMLNEAGGRVPMKGLLPLVAAICSYCFSDLNIKKLVTVLAPVGSNLETCLLSTSLTYILLAGVGLCIVFPARLHRTPLGVWRLAFPQALSWFLAMCFFYLAIDAIGVVFAVIMQSNRGWISIGLGVIVSRMGLLHLEQRVSRGVVWKRVAGALLMVGAVWLFYRSSSPKQEADAASGAPRTAIQGAIQGATEGAIEAAMSPVDTSPGPVHVGTRIGFGGGRSTLDEGYW